MISSAQPAAAAPCPAGAEWWRGPVIYQIYPRSFADSDSDGIAARLPYLARLGVEVVWLSPFYRSPQADAGYDVADYRAVDPLFGTLEDFDCLLRQAHAAGLRVIVDLVPNHASDEHAWFRAAAGSRPGSPERALHLSRRARCGRRAAAQQLAERVRRQRLVPGPRRPAMVLAPVRSPAAGPWTGSTPRCAPSLKACCASGWTAAWTGSASVWPMASSRRPACPTGSGRRPWSEI